MSESEVISEAPGQPEPKKTELFADWQIVMSKNKAVETDTKGVYSDYPSHLACVRKVEELITGTKISYYQLINYTEGAIGIETVITHASGDILPTGTIYIPFTKKDALGIATAIGWAKRLSLVHAFSLGTLEREIEPKSWGGMGATTGTMAPPFKPASPQNLEDIKDDLPEPTVEERIAQINSVNNPDALVRLFKSFPKSAQDNRTILHACTARKIAITPPENPLPPLPPLSKT